jgi:hypothetical protein
LLDLLFVEHKFYEAVIQASHQLRKPTQPVWNNSPATAVRGLSFYNPPL